MAGIKHLIECHCYLKIYDQKEKSINHKFPVYSKLDESGNLIPKFAKCNNCDALHKIVDVCKSELMPGKEENGTVLEKDDLVCMLPDKVANVLIKNQCDVADFEHALDIIEEKLWGSYIVIKRDIISEEQQLKVLLFKSESNIRIINKEIKTILINQDE
jgi:hypothetical protein